MESTHIYCQCCDKIKPIEGSREVLTRYSHFPESEMIRVGIAKKFYYREWYVLQCKRCIENEK